MSEPRALLRAMFDAALAAAQPARCLAPFLPERPTGRLIVVGGGKASAAMARVAEHHYDSLEGLVVTRYGHAVACRAVAIVEAAHPVPDQAGADAAERMLRLVTGLGADDLVLCLISGGGSALMTLPAACITLAEMRALTDALLRSGATIGEINTVRRHLSRIAGGRLAAAAYPARLVTLAISDVPGDDPVAIASGPTVADPTTLDQARAVLARHAIAPAASIAARLCDPAAETPKPGDARLSRAEFRLVASPRLALDAAARVAREAGLRVVDLGDRVEGEAREVGEAHARLARAAERGSVILSGGETTVTVRGQGRGGRNSEYLLGLTIALDAASGIHALAADTDGIDGRETNAGAMAAPDSLARATALGLDARTLLADNDAYRFFEALGDLVVTGPTLTNVNDFRAIVVA